jgi:DNA-binding transcriptional LysR family regulator
MALTTTSLHNRLLGKARFRHMAVLVKLVELGSMSRTAASLRMTQPAVSQLLAEVEALLEAPLFLRHAKGVEPTALALDLLPMARRIALALEESVDAIASRLQHDGGLVRVAATPAGIGGILHRALPAFAAARPEVRVLASEVLSQTALEIITTGDCDVLCMREPLVHPEGWTFEPCVEDALVVVCGATHPLARQAEISLADLRDAAWMLNRVGSMTHLHFEAAVEQWGGMIRKPCQVITQVPSLTFSVLAEGKHLAIVPRQALRQWLEAGLLVELRTPLTQLVRPTGFLWQPTRASPAVSAFAAHLKGS